LRIVILGSAAGGGSPQWNCACKVCALHWPGHWSGDKRVPRRTQSSIAVSVDGSNWTIINCSPDIREQISANRILQPTFGLGIRQSPIASVVLTNGDLDHIGGLLTLREKHRFSLWRSTKVARQLSENSVFSALDPALVTQHDIKANVAFAPLEGITMVAFTVPGKVPLYREATEGHGVSRSGDTVGLHISVGTKRVSYVPGCGDIDDVLLADLAQSDLLLFDGTLWTDDEMITSGTGEKTGRRMGHVPVSGADGSMAGLSSLKATRVFIHMNNTNPLLIDDSDEQKIALQRGWTVARDGMEFTL
jgi:pyrroloquinoline quinone biosynthesis protein B